MTAPPSQPPTTPSADQRTALTHTTIAVGKIAGIAVGDITLVIPTPLLAGVHAALKAAKALDLILPIDTGDWPESRIQDIARGAYDVTAGPLPFWIAPHPTLTLAFASFTPKGLELGFLIANERLANAMPNITIAASRIAHA